MINWLFRKKSKDLSLPSTPNFERSTQRKICDMQRETVGRIEKNIDDLFQILKDAKQQYDDLRKHINEATSEYALNSIDNVFHNSLKSQIETSMRTVMYSALCKVQDAEKNLKKLEAVQTKRINSKY